MKTRPRLIAYRCLMLAVVASLTLVHLGTPILWGDEAATCSFGRNVLQHGYPYAWDGRNLLAFGNCVALGEGLVSRAIPWVQYYVAAASIALFGDSAGGVRALFALIGILSAVPLWAVLRRVSVHPTLLTAAALLSPQVVLYQRNARYYPLLTFLFAGLTWGLFGGLRSARTRAAVQGVCLTLIFHVMPLAGLAAGAALVAHAALLERRQVPARVLIAGAAFLCWFGWFLAFPPVEGGMSRLGGLGLLARAPGTWLVLFAYSLAVWVRDLDRVGALPLLAWVAAVAAAKLRGVRLREVVREPLVAFVLLNVAALVLLSTGLLMVERVGHTSYAQIRYLPHLLPWFPVPLVVLLGRAWPAGDGRASKWAVAAVVALALVNLGTLGTWLPPAGAPRRGRASWAAPVYRELLAPPPDDLARVVAELRRDATRPDPLLLARPAFLIEVFHVTLGDRYRLRPSVQLGTRCAQAIAAEVGGEVLHRLREPPDCIVVDRPLRNLPASYRERVVTIRRAALDGTRPTLTRHRFFDPEGGVPLRILRRVNQ